MVKKKYFLRVSEAFRQQPRQNSKNKDILGVFKYLCMLWQDKKTEWALRICAHNCGREHLCREQIGKFITSKVLTLMAVSLYEYRCTEYPT